MAEWPEGTQRTMTRPAFEDVGQGPTYPRIYLEAAPLAQPLNQSMTRLTAIGHAQAAAQQATHCAIPLTDGQRADYQGAQAWAAISQAWAAYAAIVPALEGDRLDLVDRD